MDGMLSPDISGLSETNDQSRESCSGHHTNCPENVVFFKNNDSYIHTDTVCRFFIS